MATSFSNPKDLTVDQLSRFDKATTAWTIDASLGDQNIEGGREGDYETVYKSDVVNILSALGLTGDPSQTEFWSNGKSLLRREIARKKQEELQLQGAGPTQSEVEDFEKLADKISDREGISHDEALNKARAMLQRGASTVDQQLGSAPRGDRVLNVPSKSKSEAQDDSLKSGEEPVRREIQESVSRGLRAKESFQPATRKVYNQFMGQLFGGSRYTSASGDQSSSLPGVTGQAFEGLAPRTRSLGFFNRAGKAISGRVVGKGAKDAATKVAAGAATDVAVGAATGGAGVAVKKAITAVLSSDFAKGLRERGKDLVTFASMGAGAAGLWLLSHPLAGLTAGIMGSIGFFVGGPLGGAIGFGTGAAIGLGLESLFGAGSSILSFGTGSSTLAVGTPALSSATLMSAAAPLTVLGIGLFSVISAGSVFAMFMGEPDTHQHEREAVFSIEKAASPNALPDYDGSETIISYGVTVKAGANPITITGIKDTITRYTGAVETSANQPPAFSEEVTGIQVPQGEIAAGSSELINYQVTISGLDFKDTYLVNAATVVVIDSVTGKEETQIASVAIPINNPPTLQPYGFPVAGSVNSLDKKFGSTSTKVHTSYFRPIKLHVDGGIDIGGAPNAPVLSTSDGVVLEKSDWYPPSLGCNGTGGSVWVQSGPYVVEYLHLNVPTVKPGQFVTRGTPLGTVYPTGLNPCTSTGAHIHYQIALNGGNVDFANDNNAGSCAAGKIEPFAPKAVGEQIPESAVAPACTGTEPEAL